MAKGQAECQLTKAKAEAEANELVAKSITAELIQWQAIEKWDGKLPSAMMGDKSFFTIPMK